MRTPTATPLALAFILLHTGCGPSTTTPPTVILIVADDLCWG